MKRYLLTYLLSTTSRSAVAVYALGGKCVFVCVIKFCKQDVSKLIYGTDLCKIYVRHFYVLPWKRLIFGADHIQDG